MPMPMFIPMPMPMPMPVPCPEPLRLQSERAAARGGVRRITRRLAVALGLGLASLLSTAAPRFADWSEGFAADWVRLSPERATSTQYFNASEQAALDRQLGSGSLVQRDRRLALARRGLSELAALTEGGLSEQEQDSAAILRWSLQRSLDGAPFERHEFVFNQLNGAHLRYLQWLAETHPLRKLADVDSWLALLALVPERLDQAIARARLGAEHGLLPPRFILERARGQVAAVLAQDVQDNDMLRGLVRRSAGIEGLAPAQGLQAIDSARALLQSHVLPAYRRVLALMDELLPRTTADAGLWRLPEGEQAYAQALATNTTTPMGAEQIHALGLREVARLEAEMAQIFETLGQRQGSVKDRLAALSARLQPAAEPDPRPDLLERYRAAVLDAERRAAKLFNLTPRAPLEVRRVPVLTERTASAHYTVPAPDGSRPGIFWVPLPGPNFGVLTLRTLAVHEAVPGHHFQLALQQEQADLPRWRQRRIFGGGSAHSEGWALYAERLAIDEGWYADDPQGLLGALSSQLFRARRLVVDTGLHAKRWSREQAIDYGIGASEVERYVANPGQATAYMVGMLRILELREQARQALGDRFDIKDFHDVVLRAGSMPLDVLASVVVRWVQRSQR